MRANPFAETLLVSLLAKSRIKKQNGSIVGSIANDSADRLIDRSMRLLCIPIVP
jgi:hypothetical protein